MIFHETRLSGVWAIDIAPECDERGFFARTWCRNEFEARGLTPILAQCSTSFNPSKGTLRGLHYQKAPYGESKLVRCTRGSIYDVVTDLRPHSPTFAKWAALTLTAGNHRMVYVPEGCGHGFLTLEDNSEVFYQISQFFHPESACGVRWNDPRFEIEWPAQPRVISARDRSYPDFR
jgi:dTDP-4-dehydrorhamnose 3,5-epimerase